METADETFQRSSTLLPPNLGLVARSRHGVRTVPFPAGSELVIGRDASCQLSLPDPALSRQHARFSRSLDSLIVEDLGSRHGTWIAGSRIERAELTLGAAVRMADVIVTVTYDLRPDLPAASLPALVHEALYLSPAMREVHALLHRVARTDLPVLIAGETGTGKELAARELHLASPRRDGPLRVLNCAAIPPHLIESTLFGHERGAFTGADRARPSIFEEAHGGTVFLDEVGELPLGAQAALLRVLETKCLTRVGSHREIEVDARVVSATHRDLHTMASRGEFRADILHRLCVFVVELPPLRSRREEIAPLARHFLAQEKSPGAVAIELEPSALSRLEAHDWPGNIRELRNVIARAAVLARGPCITDRELSSWLGENKPADTTATSAPATLRTRLASVEREAARRALEQTQGNQRRAAELLGIPLRTFERRLQAWRQAEQK